MQWLTTFLVLGHFNTVPHVVIPTIQLFCCYIMTVIMLLLKIIM